MKNDFGVFKPVIYRRKAFWLTLLILLWVVVLPLLFSIARAQTHISPWQLRSTITAVEWARCEWSGTTAGGQQASCVGLEYFRFRLKDGTYTDPYVTIPWKGFAKDPLKWRNIPVTQN